MQRDGGPGGAGGAGNPVGGSYTGKAEALEIVGDFAYGYNQSEMTGTANTVFEFRTGNYLFVGTVEFIGPINFTAATIAAGSVGAISIALGGNTIAYLKNETDTEDMRQASTFNIIIPAYTDVKIQSLNAGDDANYIQSTAITGRIYRG